MQLQIVQKNDFVMSHFKYLNISAALSSTEQAEVARSNISPPSEILLATLLHLKITSLQKIKIFTFVL